MRANQLDAFVLVLVVLGTSLTACAPSGPPSADLGDIIDALDANQAIDDSALARVLESIPMPRADTSHVACDSIASIVTRVGGVEVPGPPVKICAEKNVRKNSRGDLDGGRWIADITVYDWEGTPKNVPHLGAEPGDNRVLVIQTGGVMRIMVFPEGSRPVFRNVVIWTYPKGEGHNATDIAVWRGNITTGCISCFKYGWCEIGN